ncbi:MAG: solute carrier family 23 protein [Nitratireductor sp.]
MSNNPHPVDEVLPAPKMFTLGLQHVLVMYAGAIAVPLIIGRVLKLEPEQVAFLISADLFVCGIVSILQSLGATQWFGIKLPVMMGVTFASVGPMVSIGLAHPGTEGARMIFGAIIGAGIFGVLVAPVVSRMLRFFPPVVTGTIILVIGVTLMRIGINWIFGLPVGPTSPKLVNPEHADWLKTVTEMAGAGGAAVPDQPRGFGLSATMNNPAYAPVSNIVLSLVVLATVLGVARLQGLHRQHRGPDRYCGRWCNCSGTWHDELLQGCRGKLVCAHHAFPLRSSDLRSGSHRYDVTRHDRCHDRVNRHVPRPWRHHWQEGDAANAFGRTAHGWPGHTSRRHVQHIPLYLVLAECRPCRRYRHSQPLCLRHWRRDPGDTWPDPQNGCAGRGALPTSFLVVLAW